MFESYVKVKDYDGMKFIPFHKIKKENNGIEPYIKSVFVGIGPTLYFFKFKGIIYALKPTENKDVTQMLCIKVENPITLRSADGSITGNCAKGIKDEYVNYMRNLVVAGLAPNEIFRHAVFNVDKVK